MLHARRPCALEQARRSTSAQGSVAGEDWLQRSARLQLRPSRLAQGVRAIPDRQE
jgi:hypothetical protein